MQWMSNTVTRMSTDRYLLEQMDQTVKPENDQLALQHLNSMSHF